MHKLHLLLVSSLALAPVVDAQKFVVANRGAGNITVHDASDGTRELVVPLPVAAQTPEPMYVVQVRDEVLVGDRANNRVVRFDKTTFTVVDTIAAGNGVFHMWAGPRQLWINNDIDNTSTVVDTRTMQVIDTVAMPADLVAAGYKPHDVFVGRRFAYVSLLGGSGADDWVVQFDLRTRTERRRQAVGGDPHLWLDSWRNRLYVASQDTGEVATLRATNLSHVASLPLPGAHGVFQPAGTPTLLVTDITGGGQDDVHALRTWPFAPTISDTESSGVATAHNIAATAFGRRVMVTHSGATSDEVTLYRLDYPFGIPWLPFFGARVTRIDEIEADTNPFGIAVVY